MLWYTPTVGKANSKLFSQLLGCLGLLYSNYTHSLLYSHVLFFLQEQQEDWGHDESAKEMTTNSLLLLHH